jgi:hypothetical protein
MPVLLVLAGCQPRDDRGTVAGQSPSTSQAALGAASVQGGSEGSPALTISPAANATDSIVAWARAVLRSARPTFHGWDDSSTAEISLEDAGPVPFASRPIVGDFDEDGTSDVAFIGQDAGGEHIVAVLSHRGQTAIVDVTSDEAVATSGAKRRRWMRLATVDTDHRQVGLEIIEREADGEFPLPASQYVYRGGRFMQWIEGN